MIAQGINPLDWIGIVLYVGELLAISACHLRKPHVLDEVFLAGRERNKSKWPISSLHVTGRHNRPDATTWIGLKVVSGALVAAANTPVSVEKFCAEL